MLEARGAALDTRQALDTAITAMAVSPTSMGFAQTLGAVLMYAQSLQAWQQSTYYSARRLIRSPIDSSQLHLTGTTLEYGIERHMGRSSAVFAADVQMKLSVPRMQQLLKAWPPATCQASAHVAKPTSKCRKDQYQTHWNGSDIVKLFG